MALVVVGRGGERVEPVSHNRAQFLDAVEVRSLTVLFLLVVDLVAVNKHLEDSTHAGLHLDGYLASTFSYELVDHPGRDTVILSRYAVDDLNVHLSFASHSTTSYEIDRFVIYTQHKRILCQEFLTSIVD